MCGISGSYTESIGFDGIAHRGYTGTHYATEQLDAVHYRLPFVDVDNGDQPKTHNGWTVWLTGEVYNFDQWDKQSDVIAIAKALDKHGPEAFEKFNGHFAIVAHNKGKVYLARDRFGSRPLYYSRTSNGFLFSSECKDIISRIGKRLDIHGVGQWLTFQTYLDNSTIWEGVKRVKPGTYAVYDPQVPYIFIQRYWQVPEEQGEADPETVRGLVEQSVERQQAGEGCVWYSGGLDSSILRSLMNLPTITADFPGEFGEKVDKGDLACLVDNPGNIAGLAYYHDDPHAGPCFADFRLSEFTKANGFRLVFTGAGADELFNGYPWRRDREPWAVVNRTGLELGEMREYLYSHFQDMRRFDFDHFLPGILLTTDRALMSNTIEGRMPFCDNDLAEYALSCVQPKGKEVLKQAFSDLPKSVLDKPKWGFTSPYDMLDEYYVANRPEKALEVVRALGGTEKDNRGFKWSVLLLDAIIKRHGLV